MINRTELIFNHPQYVAGLFDGEGSFYIGVNNKLDRGKDKRSYYPVASLAIREEEIIDALISKYGGYKSHKKATDTRAKQYRWQIKTSNVITFIDDISPFLIIKRPQAYLLKNFQNMKSYFESIRSGDLRKLSDPEYLYHQSSHIISKKLNKVGVNKSVKPIVMVSGGFDPVTYAHVLMIEEAAKIGHIVVGVNSDDWLMRKKGYVFMKQEERLAIMNNFKGVLFSTYIDDKDDTACEVIQRIKPDYFANGGDRTSTNTPEQSVCNDLNIKMIWEVGGSEKIQSSSWLVNNAIKQLQNDSN